MNKIIKTEISGIPVELELVQAAATSSENITSISQDVIVADGNGGSRVPSIKTPSNQVRVVSIGSEEKPASPNDIDKITQTINGNKNVGKLIDDLIANLQTSGKDWWTSKVIWTNILGIFIPLIAYWGFDLKEYVNVEVLATILSVVFGMINLYYRKGTDIPINPIKIPGTQITVMK